MSEQGKARREACPTVFTERFGQLFEEDETQEHFAKRVGLTRNTVAAYYNGYISWPTSEAIRKICASCKVSADWLIGLSSVREPDRKTLDPDKIVEALKCHAAGECEPGNGTDEMCPYWHCDNCVKKLMYDAIALIRDEIIAKRKRA